MPKALSTEPKFVVVVGTSAGGLNSIIELSMQLTAAMDLAVFIVMHVSRTSFSDIILHRIQKATVFTCKVTENEDAIRSKHLYLAPGDRHLVLEKGRILLGDGPTENRWRPSIDVLFRSAAAAYDGRCIGIILTGLLNDGASGMLAIKRSGGVTMVQDPTQAEYPRHAPGRAGRHATRLLPAAGADGRRAFGEIQRWHPNAFVRTGRRED